MLSHYSLLVGKKDISNRWRKTVLQSTRFITRSNSTLLPCVRSGNIHEDNANSNNSNSNDTIKRGVPSPSPSPSPSTAATSTANRKELLKNVFYALVLSLFFLVIVVLLVVAFMYSCCSTGSQYRRRNNYLPIK
jgi:hypothetical protein